MEKHAFGYRVVRNIKRKDQSSFAVFDIESFYRCISTKLFDEAASFVKMYYDFTYGELEMIMHSRKRTLVWQDSTWVTKEDDEDFDIPMVCYDGAEICELAGIYIQNKLCMLVNKKYLGLDRDDGLRILRNTSGPKADRKHKCIIKIFKECGLSISCEVCKKIVHFLDVRFNLNEHNYELTESQTMNPFTSTSNQSIHQT